MKGHECNSWRKNKRKWINSMREKWNDSAFFNGHWDWFHPDFVFRWAFPSNAINEKPGNETANETEMAGNECKNQSAKKSGQKWKDHEANECHKMSRESKDMTWTQKYRNMEGNGCKDDERERKCRCEAPIFQAHPLAFRSTKLAVPSSKHTKHSVKRFLCYRMLLPTGQDDEF